MKTIHIRDTEAFHRALDHIAGRAPIRAHLVATRDTALQQIHDTHDPQIAAIDEDIKAHLEAAEAYATAYRTELLPKGIKTAETTLATWGFRTGQPVLKLLTRKHTWTTVLERLKATPAYKAYIRTKEEPDKEALRRDLSETDLAAIGLRTDQAETFWTEPKVESGNRLTTPADPSAN